LPGGRNTTIWLYDPAKMPSPRNKHYETLGVPPTASAGEIREAYRKLARQCHPDLNPGDNSAEERFKKLQQANQVLSDLKKRQAYDQVELHWEGGSAGAGPGTTGAADPNPATNTKSFYRTPWMQEGVSGTGRRDFYVPELRKKEAPIFTAGVKSFFADAAIGLLAMAVAIPAALHFGGFSYEDLG
jgi:curved DNA-binding protein CbpA